MAAKAAIALKEAKAGKAGKAEKASKPAPSSKPKPEAEPFHNFVFGDEVEVFGHEEGFEGSWYAAEVLVAKDQHQLLVQYESLFDEASAQPLKEWCHPELLRPVPPRPPADWASHLVAGQALDLSHDDGWWEVRRSRGEGRSSHTRGSISRTSTATARCQPWPEMQTANYV